MSAIRTIPTFLFLSLCVTMVPHASAQPASDREITVQPNIVYRQVKGLQLQLDIIAPKVGAEPRPTILLVHGIGFTQGRIGLREHATKLATLRSSSDFGTNARIRSWLPWTTSRPPLTGFVRMRNSMISTRTALAFLVFLAAAVWRTWLVAGNRTLESDRELLRPK